MMNRSPLLPLVLLLTFFLLAGCNAKDKKDDVSSKDQIKQDVDDWVKGVAKGDVEDYFRFITDDFIFIGQGKPVSGKDSLRSFLTSVYANYRVSMPKWESQEIEISDALAIHRYAGIVYIHSKKDSVTFESDRKYLDVLKKNEKGEWKVYLHAFNHNH